MTSKQKKMLYRIITAFVLFVVLMVLESYWSVRAVTEPVACIPDLSDPVSGDRL